MKSLAATSHSVFMLFSAVAEVTVCSFTESVSLKQR